VIQVQ